MEATKTVFNTLRGVNVNEHTESKNGLTYLSWAWAWDYVKSLYPSSAYDIKKFGEEQLPYQYVESLGYLVWTSITIEGETLEMWLPVMDGANKAMKKEPYKYTITKNGKQIEKTVEGATMFDINKTIMRCLVKNLSMFGLGLYIYSGEDLPDAEVKANEKLKTKIATIKKNASALVKKNVDVNDIYKVIMTLNNGEKNPETITDIETANKVLESLKELKPTKESK